MSSSTRIAAIDVGSNAIRLVVGEIDPATQEPVIIKKFREPVRLGKDTFAAGYISRKSIESTVRAFEHFHKVIQTQNAVRIRAVATSSLRESTNRQDVISAVEAATGIKIDVISGIEEGKLIFRAVQRKIDLSKQRALLIDIGGGSVELTDAIAGEAKSTRTFPLGTVRLLEALKHQGLKERHLSAVIASTLGDVRAFLRARPGRKSPCLAIGTGGNYECLGRLRVGLLSKSSSHTMTASDLDKLASHLLSMSLKQRVRFLMMREDRADVVVPAALVTLAIMHEAGAEELSIPFVGLRDGLLTSLAEETLKSLTGLAPTLNLASSH